MNTATKPGEPERATMQDSIGIEKKPDRVPWKLALSLLLFTIVIFFNVINQFFSLDYFDLLYSAKYNNLPDVLLARDTSVEGGFFRPVGMFVFWLQMRLFGFIPAVYNLTVVILHAITAILAVNLYYLLFGNLRCAAIFGFVFIAFPNHAETIHWLAIFDVWVAVFYLGTLLLFCYYRLYGRVSFFIWSLFLFVLALLSKELAVTLPASLIVLDFFFSRAHGIALPAGRRAVDHGTYFGLLLATILLTRFFLNIGSGYVSAGGTDFVISYMSDIGALVHDFIQVYLQSFMYLIAPISPKFPFAEALIFQILLTVAVVFALLARKRRLNWPAVIYSAVFLLIALLPAIATFKVFGISHWIRFLYLPSIGSCYVIAMMLDGIMEGINNRRARYGFVSLALIPMIFLTKLYDDEWIRTREENRETIQTIVEQLREYPKYSRIYVSGIRWMTDGIPLIGHAFPSAIALYYDREYIQASLDFLPPERELVLEREKYDERDWNYFWLVWNGKAKTLRKKRSIQPKPNKSGLAPRWDFGQRGDQRGLVAVNGIFPVLAPESRYPSFVVDGEWGLIKLPAMRAGTPIKYLTIEMMLRYETRQKDIARILWITEDDPDYSGKKSIGFFTVLDGEFHEYKIPLYRNGLTLIDPGIIRFAIRPSQKKGTVVSLRKATVEYY